MLIVTGGIGFIGSWYCDEVLSRDNDEFIICVDCLASCTSTRTVEYLTSKYGVKRFELIVGDICEQDTIAKLRERVGDSYYELVHFAADTLVDYSFTNPQDVSRTNICGTQNMLEFVRLTTASSQLVPLFVHISTDEVYGEQLDCLEEGTLLQPTTPYAAAKASAEMLVQAYTKTWKLRTKIIRCSNVFGPRQFPEKIVPIACANLITGQPTTLHGTGLNKRRYLFVTDAVDAIELVHHNGQDGQIYNIGSGPEGELTNLELLNLLIRLEGTDSTLIQFGPDRLYNDSQYSMNCDKATELGWAPKVGLVDGMRRCLEWTHANPDWFAKKAAKKPRSDGVKHEA